MRTDAIVVGAGIVGISVALHLQKAGDANINGSTTFVVRVAFNAKRLQL